MLIYYWPENDTLVLAEARWAYLEDHDAAGAYSSHIVLLHLIKKQLVFVGCL